MDEQTCHPQKLPMVLPMYHIGMHRVAPEAPVQKHGRGKLVKIIPNLGEKNTNRCGKQQRKKYEDVGSPPAVVWHVIYCRCLFVHICFFHRTACCTVRSRPLRGFIDVHILFWMYRFRGFIYSVSIHKYSLFLSFSLSLSCYFFYKYSCSY